MALVVPLMVTSEVMVLTTGVWVVEVVSAEVVLSATLVVEESLDEVVEEVEEVVDGGASEVEEVVDVVCVVVVLGASVVEEVDDVVEEVLEGAEVGSEEELLVDEDPLVISLRTLVASAL